VDGTGSGSCPVVGSGIGGAEPSRSALRDLFRKLTTCVCAGLECRDQHLSCAASPEQCRLCVSIASYYCILLLYDARVSFCCSRPPIAVFVFPAGCARPEKVHVPLCYNSAISEWLMTPCPATMLLFYTLAWKINFKLTSWYR
jgi:hypothetical protein